MWRNHLKIILRSFIRNRFYSLINILGLAIGFAAFILILIFVHYETNFENFHSKADRIFRPTYKYDSQNGYKVQWARIPVDYINELPNEFPEIETLIPLSSWFFAILSPGSCHALEILVPSLRSPAEPGRSGGAASRKR